MILNGDSFTVGNGTDYSETLPYHLRADEKIDTYSIAFPSEPPAYYKRAEWFLDNISSNVEFGIIFYEGNDFFASEDAKKIGFIQSNLMPKTLAEILNEYDKFRITALTPYIRLLNFSSDFFLLSRRLESEFFKREDTSVSYYKIADKWTGFLNTQGTLTVDPAPYLPDPLPEKVGRSAKCVFLAPTKMRVYRKWLPTEVSSHIVDPPPALLALKEKFGKYNTKIVDLSPVLQQAAEKYYPSGEFVYWRDDTHWNGRGMNSVSSLVADCLRN